MSDNMHESKVVLVSKHQAIKWGEEGSHILNLGTKWRWGVSFMF